MCRLEPDLLQSQGAQGSGCFTKVLCRCDACSPHIALQASMPVICTSLDLTCYRVKGLRESGHITTSHSRGRSIFSEIADGHDSSDAPRCSIISQGCFLC